MSILSYYIDNVERGYAASDLFQLFSIGFSFPTGEFARGMVEGTFTDDVVSCLEELGAEPEVVIAFRDGMIAACADKTTEELLDELKKEHTRLYGNMAHPLIWIYETMFKYDPSTGEKEPSLFISNTCLHVEQSMRHAGAKLSENNKQPADYMPNELVFFAFLLNKYSQGLEASRTGDPASLDPREIGQDYGFLEEFWLRHLNLWIGGFMEQTQSMTKSPVYRALAQAVLAAIDEENFSRA